MMNKDYQHTADTLWLTPARKSCDIPALTGTIFVWNFHVQSINHDGRSSQGNLQCVIIKYTNYYHYQSYRSASRWVMVRCLWKSVKMTKDDVGGIMAYLDYVVCSC